MVTISYPDWTSVLEQELRRAENASIAVAFLTKAGLEFGEIRQTLVQALQRGARIRVLVELSTGTTDPSALWDLLTFNLPSHAGLEIRAFLPESRSILHTKFYLFRSQGEMTLLTGSANWTASAFDANVEHGVILRGTQSDALLIEAEQFFDRLWGSPRARPLDQEVIRLYEAFHGRISGVSGRAQRRASASWRRLLLYFEERVPTLVWPSLPLAYLMGAIAARGIFIDVERKIIIKLLFRSGSYKGGEIRVGGVGYPAADFLPRIPEFLTDRLRQLFAPYPSIEVRRTALYEITVNCSREASIYRIVRQPFGTRSNCNEFRLPQGLTTAESPIVEDFVRGFATACALVTDGTSFPRNRALNLPGRTAVWLRPKEKNVAMFNHLEQLIEHRLGIPVHRHARRGREPHLKIYCEDFQERIGFGIDWWDRLVEEGARSNLAVFGES